MFLFVLEVPPPPSVRSCKSSPPPPKFSDLMKRHFKVRSNQYIAQRPKIVTVLYKNQGNLRIVSESGHIYIGCFPSNQILRIT